jgi:capsule polysaccharide export protein KpsE/RkpR
MEPVPNANPSTSPEIAHAGELDLFALFMLLRRHIRRIFLFSLVTTLLMVVFTLAVKPRYSATVAFLVPLPNAATSAAAAAFLQSANADIVGGGPTSVYVDMLKSHVIADEIINQFGLMQIYKVKELNLAENALWRNTKVEDQREGLINVTVQAGDPKLAANLANAYLAQLEQLNERLAIGSASLQRRYYEQEMVKEKNHLADAEVALRQTQESTGVIAPQLQEQSGLSAADQTRAQLRARQVELGALLQGATQQNPEVIRLQAEIGSLESQLKAMQNGGGGPAVSNPAAKVPGQVLAYVRNEREVKFHEALFEMLAHQYESAKEQEAKDFSTIQVLDPATVPERKSWPPRTLYCLIAIVAGALLGVLYTVIEAFVGVVVGNPRNREKLQQFKTGKSVASTGDATSR